MMRLKWSIMSSGRHGKSEVKGEETESVKFSWTREKKAIGYPRKTGVKKVLSYVKRLATGTLGGQEDDLLVNRLHPPPPLSIKMKTAEGRTGWRQGLQTGEWD